MTALLVALAGAAGALTRYGVGTVLGERDLPWATFAINVVGAFLLAVVLTAAGERRWSPEVTAAVSVGFLGAFTTFSTFTWEVLSLGRADRVGAAVLYVAITVVAGLAAAAAGLATGRALVG